LLKIYFLSPITTSQAGYIIVIFISKVVKTGPDRAVGPVEPGTGPESGPVVLQKRSAREPNKTAKTGKKNREKPVTRPVQAVQLQCLKKKTN
jgi:hypothetical protein